MFKWIVIFGTALVVLTVGCSSTTAPVPRTANQVPRVRTATPVPATAEEAIRQLINAECEAVVQQDVDRLQAMWSKDGTVTDANHSAANRGDDVTWKGWDALRDRYVNIVFPSNPTFCEHFDLKVTIIGDSAEATGGVKIGQTNAAAADRWTFRNDGEGWQILSLTYNLQP